MEYAGLGFELIMPAVLLLLGGRWLDTRLGTDPWLMITGAVLGFIAGFVNFFRRVLPRGGPEGRG